MYDFAYEVNRPREDDLRLVAGEDLKDKRFYIVGLKDEEVIILDSRDPASDVLLGVLQNAPLPGEVAIVRTLGLSFVVSGDAIAVGDWLVCGGSSAYGNDAGKAYVYTGDYQLGQCVRASSGGDAEGAVLLRPFLRGI